MNRRNFVIVVAATTGLVALARLFGRRLSPEKTDRPSSSRTLRYGDVKIAYDPRSLVVSVVSGRTTCQVTALISTHAG